MRSVGQVSTPRGGDRGLPGGQDFFADLAELLLGAYLLLDLFDLCAECLVAPVCGIGGAACVGQRCSCRFERCVSFLHSTFGFLTAHACALGFAVVRSRFADSRGRHRSHRRLRCH